MAKKKAAKKERSHSEKKAEYQERVREDAKAKAEAKPEAPARSHGLPYEVCEGRAVSCRVGMRLAGQGLELSDLCHDKDAATENMERLMKLGLVRKVEADGE